jgi:hypothetical protein
MAPQWQGPWIRNLIDDAVIKRDCMTTVHVYLRTVDYAMGLVKFGGRGFVNCPLESFLSDSGYALQCQPGQWYARGQGTPAAMHEVYEAPGLGHFFERGESSFLMLQRRQLEVTCFDDRMLLASLLDAYYGGIDEHASDIFLCITVLDILGIYPITVSMSRFLPVQAPTPRTIDFFFGHRSGNSLFRVRMSGVTSETLGLYLKAALRAAADYNAGPMSRARTSAQLIQKMTRYCQCGLYEMPWGLANFWALVACTRSLYKITGQSLRATELVYIWLQRELPGTRKKPLYIPLRETVVSRAICLATPISAYALPSARAGVLSSTTVDITRKVCCHPAVRRGKTR